MDGKSLKVNLIANTSQFKSAMTESSRQISLLNSEFKKASNETDQYGNKLDSTSAKKKQLSGVIEQYKNRIVAIKNEQRHWTKELERGNITEEQHAQKQQELARRLNNTEGEMKRYEGQLKRLNAEGKATTRTYADFDRQFRNVGKTMRDVGTTVGITAGVGFIAMKRVLGDVVNEAKDFYAQMSEVQAISGATGEEMGRLTKQAKDLGRATKFTAEEAAQSQANLARAGFKTNEIIGAMPGLLDLAASSNLDLGTSADITANIIRTFGFEAEKAGDVADVLAKGAASANIDVQGLGGSMKTAGPIAKSLGITFESVAAATGIMADAGLAGEEAGRMLRQGMLRLSKPTGEAAKIIKKMGVEVFDANGNMKSLDQVVGELQKGMKGYTGQQKSAALATLFGSESTAGWTVLLDKGSDALADYTVELENSEGAAKEMADVMQDNAAGAITRMESALSGLKIELGEKLLPTISQGADLIGDLATTMAEWDEETINTIAQTGLLVTAVLGVTTAVAGLVAGVGAFMAFAGPVGMAITGGTLLLGGLAAAIYTNQQRTKKLAEEQEKAKVNAERYGDGLSEGTLKGVKGYVDLYEGAKVKMLELKNMSGKEAEATSAQIVKAFSEMGDAVIAELEVQKEKLTRAIDEIYSVAGSAGEKAASEMTDKVLEEFDADIARYKKAVDTVRKVQEEFNGDVSKAPKELQKAYKESLDIMNQGTREFAQTQQEMQVLQDEIYERQKGIMFDEVSDYTKRINDTYAKSIEKANEWSTDTKETLEQARLQNKISQEDYNNLIVATEAKTSEMIAKSVSEREKSLDGLANNLNERGRLIDLSTGEEFEKLTWLQTNSAGVRTQMEESELQYYERWKQHVEDHVASAADFSEKTLQQQRDTLVATLETLGMTREQAVKEAEKLMQDTLNELDKGEDKARESGKKKGDAHKEGINSTKEENKKSAKEVSDGTKDKLDTNESGANEAGKKKGKAHKDGIDSTKEGNKKSSEELSHSALEYMKKYDKEAKSAGKKKGDSHKEGIDSTKKSNQTTAKSVSDSASKNLNTNESNARSAGKRKGDSHKEGLDSTKRANTLTSQVLSSTVSSLLGRTTDGGGGRKAGSSFNQGIGGWRGVVNATAKGVALRGRDGLSSVSTSGAGSNFVAGFRGSISNGRGSVWSTAWNLGQSALSALKRSIKTASPSKETEQVGEWFVDGYVNEIDDGKRRAAKSAQLVGKESLEALNNEVNKHKKSFGAIALAAESSQQTLKVEHTLDKKFDEFAEMFKSDKKDDYSAKILAVLERILLKDEETPPNINMNITVRSQDDIDKIDSKLNELVGRRKAAWGG